MSGGSKRTAKDEVTDVGSQNDGFRVKPAMDFNFWVPNLVVGRAGRNFMEAVELTASGPIALHTVKLNSLLSCIHPRKIEFNSALCRAQMGQIIISLLPLCGVLTVHPLQLLFLGGRCTDPEIPSPRRDQFHLKSRGGGQTNGLRPLFAWPARTNGKKLAHPAHLRLAKPARLRSKVTYRTMLSVFCLTTHTSARAGGHGSDRRWAVKVQPGPSLLAPQKNYATAPAPVYKIPFYYLSFFLSGLARTYSLTALDTMLGRRTAPAMVGTQDEERARGGWVQYEVRVRTHLLPPHTL
ncbi:hypothetical protein B0H16DRAFT_1448978 [Mycena metata]|uniref:Uncharacterized protein n=1 Tax=Mycena metata TaxID=1033252 RepID=A0AAD7K4Q1_9AGAR|nr:hypothetical protein B0H16DRAFT_1448974 [Mycena metata]KAJ7778356.1 hypothetical protein B0H16DRAFT_1448978 [Mycena metata]